MDDISTLINASTCSCKRLAESDDAERPRAHGDTR